MLSRDFNPALAGRSRSRKTTFMKSEKTEKPKEDKGLFTGVMVAYLVLLLHVLLLVLVAVAVVFFRGVVEYMPWILGGGFALVLLSGYLFFRKFRKNAEKLREVLSDPVFRDRAVEVKLFGGVASLRLGQPVASANSAEPILLDQVPVMQLEDPEAQRLRRLDQLVRLLDQGLISPEEFAQLKNELLAGPTMPIINP